MKHKIQEIKSVFETISPNDAEARSINTPLPRMEYQSIAVGAASPSDVKKTSSTCYLFLLLFW